MYFKGLSKYHNRKLHYSIVGDKRNLHGSESSRATLFIQLETTDVLKYEPGDHVGVLASNRSDLIEGIISHLDLSNTDPDKPMELQTLKETQTSSGKLNGPSKC